MQNYTDFHGSLWKARMECSAQTAGRRQKRELARRCSSEERIFAAKELRAGKRIEKISTTSCGIGRIVIGYCEEKMGEGVERDAASD
ncbi:MAG: hypothetical protein AB7E30_08505 [Lawsonibacter sp.]